MNNTPEKQTPKTTPDGLIMHEQIGVGLVVSAAEHCFMLSKWESERADRFDEGFDVALRALQAMCDDRMGGFREYSWDSGAGSSGYDEAMREVIKWADTVRDPELSSDAKRSLD